MRSTSHPALIALDWGTSSLRAWLLDPVGAAIAGRESGHGIMRLPEGGFERALSDLAGDWLGLGPRLPICACGMVGSAQGWHEAPYVPAPAGVDEVARALPRFETPSGHALHIVPGMAFEGEMPDVMRGEETQVFGAMGEQAAGARARDLYVLPGTHSKWVVVEAGRIVEFRTFMTGETFAALRDHTILGRLVAEGGESDLPAFERGVSAAAAAHARGGPMSVLFSARSLALLGRLPKTSVADYLSGLLIGAELAGAAGLFPIEQGDAPRHVTIVGSATLCERYRAAFAVVGSTRVDVRTEASRQGVWRIAARAGLVPRI